ncbi:MAG TPA: AI-2E family transporter [Gemmatimonadales bacterium]
MTEPTVKSYARETAIATSILATIAVLATLFLGRVVFMPIVLALTLTTILRPLVRWFETIRVPPAASAPAIVVGVILIAIGGMRLLAPSVSSFASQVPHALTGAKTRLATLAPPLNRLAEVIPDLGSAKSSSDSSNGRADSSKTADSATAQSVKPKAVGMHGPVPVGQGSAGASSGSSSSLGPFIARVFGTAAELVTDILQTALLLIFLLAGSDKWRRKLTGERGHPHARALVAIGDEAQACVSRYLSMLALINVAQGTLVGLTVWAIGLPSPAVWGVLTFFAEFLPYVGGIGMVALLTLVGLASSQGFGHALLAPAAYLVITTVQNSVIGPIVYGRGLQLNPAAILVSVILWLFLWGVFGAFLAVPILAIMKIVCDRIGGSLAPVSALIGD